MTPTPPKHIAIIMDGNGRWAKQRKLPIIAGHKAGADAVWKVAERAHHLGVEILTLYTFSSENWNRSVSWLHEFMMLLRWYLTSEVQKLMDRNIQLHTIGDLSRFPDDIQQLIHDVTHKTSNNTGLKIVLALGYGGRQEITQMIKNIVHEHAAGSLNETNITEEYISQMLSTRAFPDPELLIRTSGEKRISNFLLWQMAYTEFVFHGKLWPEYDGDDLENAIQQYLGRERRYGRYLDDSEQ